MDLTGGAAPAPAFRNLSVAHRQLGELDDAQAVLAQGLARFPGDLQISAENAELLMKRGNWKEAVEVLEALLPKMPEQSRSRVKVLTGLHVSYGALGDFDKARELYLQIDPNAKSKLSGLDDRDVSRIYNLLSYTKTSGSRYAARWAPGGYQTIRVKDTILEGSRRPEERFKVLPFGLEGKSVLDIGSNQGGMLFQVASQITWGVGIDYDSKMVNVANAIRQVQNYHNLNFYTFDLDRESVDLIPNFLPQSTVDVVLLFRVIGWLGRPEDTIRLISKITKTLVLQNHRDRRQNLDLVRRYFNSVRPCTEHSADPNIRDIVVCTND